jgi:hypothetical protein
MGKFPRHRSWPLQNFYRVAHSSTFTQRHKQTCTHCARVFIVDEVFGFVSADQPRWKNVSWHRNIPFDVAREVAFWPAVLANKSDSSGLEGTVLP